MEYVRFNQAKRHEEDQVGQGLRSLLAQDSEVYTGDGSAAAFRQMHCLRTATRGQTASTQFREKNISQDTVDCQSLTQAAFTAHR